MSECKDFTGLMIGILQCSHGTPHLAIQINGELLVMRMVEALVLYEQLGMHLDLLGAFEDEMPQVRGTIH